MNSSLFKKIVDNSSKYNYENFNSYVIHLSPSVCISENLSNKDQIKEYMLNKIEDISKINLEDDFHVTPHFWKYANVTNYIDDNYIYDEDLSLGICGDYFKGNNLETSYFSSKTLFEEKLT